MGAIAIFGGSGLGRSSLDPVFSEGERGLR